MSSDYDATEFIDGDFQSRPLPSGTVGGAVQLPRAPTREEVDSRVAETQQKLSELRRAQEQLERTRLVIGLLDEHHRPHGAADGIGVGPLGIGH